MHRFTAAPLAIVLLTAACTPTPRPRAVAAVVGSETPAPTLDEGGQLTPVERPSETAQPVATGDAAAVAADTPTPLVTPTLNPELPEACAAAPPASATVRDLGYEHSICRSPAISPDERWLAFAQLTEAYTGDELWVVNRVSGNQTLVFDPLWTTEAFRALGTFEWSSTNALLVVHNLASGTAPATTYDPASGELVNIGNVSTLAWNRARTAVVGWEFRPGCVFTRAVGYDFQGKRILQSATPDEEIVGRVFWLPDDSGFVYSRRIIVGDCPGCYYRAAELVLAASSERVYTTLLSDPGRDYVLFGFQDDRIVVGERPYTYHTCEAPQLPPADMTYYLLDPATRELTPYQTP